MPIRLATWSDLLPAAHVASAAFFNDAFFGDFLHPYRHTYPADVYLHFLRTLRSNFFNPRSTILISYPSASASKPQSSPQNHVCITGVAIWQCRGLGALVLDKTQSWLAWAAGKFIAVFNRFHALMYPDRSLEPANLGALDASIAHSVHYWEEPAWRKEGWYLNTCATAPEWQGRGLGREMVLWGVERARTEGVTAGLVAAEGMEGFYEKCGFELVGYATEGEGNPLAGLVGGAIMFSEKHIREKEEGEDAV